MPNPIRSVSLLKQALKDRWGAGAYIDDVLKTTRKKKWSELTDKEKGAYEALESLYSTNDDLFLYEKQLFYALQDKELFKAFKAGNLDGAFAGKILDKKINTMFDDYIKRMEEMIKGAESGAKPLKLQGRTYTADDIYAVFQEMLEEALPELMKEGKSLNMLVYPNGGSIDGAGKLNVIAGALDAMQDSRALRIGKGTWQEQGSAATKMDPTLFNLRRLEAHLDDLPEEQIAGKAGTADDFDFWDGEDATFFADADINDWSLNHDRIYAAADNVAPAGRYKPIKPAEFDIVLEGDVWPLPRKTEKVPKFEVEDIVGGGKEEYHFPVIPSTTGKLSGETGIAYVERLRAEIAAAEKRSKHGEEIQRAAEEWGLDLSVGDKQDAAIDVERAKATIKRLQEELDAYLGVTKKQGGGFIDSPLYLRDY